MSEISRSNKAKLNIIVRLAFQLTTLLCGLILPRLMMSFYGSEAYGATTSIAQFLSYITLVEGGIGSVARAALYKPLAENDSYRISLVIEEVKRFFRIVAYIFVVYVVFLASSFKHISNVECMDYVSTFMLVIVISISTFAQYFIGISYSVLLQAAQKTYITDFINIFTIILNTAFSIVLILVNTNLILVKFVSSIVFLLRPLFMWWYVKKTYGLIKSKERDANILNQKWTGLGQHIAYFLHSHTDIAILTIISSLSSVAVYSVYYMIISQMQNIAMSFSAGMEALFGDMLAKDEHKELENTFGFYESLVSFITILLFSITAVMIVPFVRIYTLGITDVNYVEPLFAIILVLSSAFYCLRKPYHSIVVAAGHFRQTRFAAYGEAVLNVLITSVLVLKFGLVGAALGTLIATLFRFIFYVFYLSKRIINIRIPLFLKRQLINMLAFVTVFIVGTLIVSRLEMSNYFEWFFASVLIGVVALILVALFNYLFYKHDFYSICKYVIKKRK